MKNTGILMIFFSIMALLPGLFLVFDQPSAQPINQSRLKLAEISLETCQIDQRYFEPGKSCAAEEAKLREMMAPRQPQIDAAKRLWGYAILSAAPFFILIGTVLFAAGKVEDAVKALSPEGAA